MDGIILINKEKNYTSNDVVQIVKKIFNQKVGHTGTLDPMATGVLPLLIGKGTLCSKYLINHDKIYVTTLKLGVKTDTGDITGNIIKTEKVDEKFLELNKVKKVLSSFIGEQEQIPPMYSAIKINGKKLYEYARNGQSLEISPRKINLYNLELISIKNEEISFRVCCSKGTYIRTLCENIAEKLGTIGTMCELNREKVGDFDIENAVTIEELKQSCCNLNFLDTHFVNIEKLFESHPKIFLNESNIKKFLNGVKLSGFSNFKDGLVRIYFDNSFIGIATLKKGVLKRDIVVREV